MEESEQQNQNQFINNNAKGRDGEACANIDLGVYK